jgi:acetylornithine deacetylase/succinyl-diaminopimelate desuccinylase-like protein
MAGAAASASRRRLHSPTEKVHKEDIKSMIEMYKLLMEKL